MKTLAVLCKNGFETIEALSTVDVFRRAGLDVRIVGMDSIEVVTSQKITIKADEVFSDKIYQYDGVFVPGGLPGARDLRDDKRAIDLISKFNEEGKIIAAICAGPIVLEKARVIDNKKVTCFPGFEKELEHANFVDGLVVSDGNIITGKGPGASLEIGYTLCEAFGKDSSSIREGMQYNYLMKTR
ncbi:MAG: DJ-1/PfpI family protein [Thomasclavelia sp.]|jgi:4-methyl-5(b-hydroxyethyl)-thiazole monophosphate biosynthesis|nr:DJ-1/PfpI family protein [Thomasclavelia sp.]